MSQPEDQKITPAGQPRQWLKITPIQAEPWDGTYQDFLRLHRIFPPQGEGNEKSCLRFLRITEFQETATEHMIRLHQPNYNAPETAITCAKPGDYIARHRKGWLYVIPKHEFLMHYKPVD